MFDILVLGATGFTGRLVTQYLYNHPERSSFTFAIGVHSKPKAESLKKSLGIDNSIQLVQVDVLQYEEVEAAVKDARVIVSTVGPYWIYGDGVVKACAVHGKRYVDLSGEPHFVKRTVDRYDYLATKTGAVIVNSCGFDSLPADILVFLSSRTLVGSCGPDAHLGLSQTFYSLRGGFSGGTFATLMSNVEEVPPVRLLEAKRDHALSPVRGHPSPEPAKAMPVPFSSPQQYGAFFPAYTTNRSVVQRSFGLNALASIHHSQERKTDILPQVYGPQFRYEEYLSIGRSRLIASAFSTTFACVLNMLFEWSPVRRVFKQLVPKPGHGPSEAKMKKGWMELTNYTQRSTSPDVWVKSVMRGQGDPGYLLTSYMLAECALALVLDDASLPAATRLGGVLTPATALGSVIIQRLEATGRIQFESEVVRGGGERTQAASR